jgi:hypothetical protein
MKITDIDGKAIEVTDVRLAIEQTEAYREFTHLNPTDEQKAFDAERKRYWTDLHEKLLQLLSD